LTVFVGFLSDSPDVVMQIDNVRLDATTVPEPTAAALLVSSSLLLLLRRKRA